VQVVAARVATWQYIVHKVLLQGFQCSSALWVMCCCKGSCKGYNMSLDAALGVAERVCVKDLCQGLQNIKGYNMSLGCV
jgi:hypothetical protein